MSNIPSYLPVAQQPTGTAPSQAVIPTPPPGLARLSAGTLIEGTVIGRTQQGLLAVKTSHGELALRTTASPPAQSRVVLQLQPSGGRFRVILLSAEPAQTASASSAPQARSQPPASATRARADPLSAGSAPLAQAPGATASNRPAASPAAQAGASLRPGAPPGAPPAAQPPGQPASGQPAGQAYPASGRPGAPPATLSTPSVLTVQSGASPATPAPVPPPGTRLAPGAAPAAAPANAAAPATANAPTGAPALASPAASPAAPGIAGSAPGIAGSANPGLAPASPPAVGGQTGQVSIPPGGSPVAAARNALPVPGAAAPSGIGQSVTGAMGTPPAGAAIAGTAIGADLIRSWPGLEQALAALRAASPQLAAPAVDAVMPRPGPQLAGTLALLISALRGGEIRGWLGQGTMRELARSSGKETASRLADEFGQLSRLARADSGEWRVHALPFFDGARHQQIQLYIKHRDKGAGGEEDIPARFVFEFDLSNLGPVQLDGLAANRRFDLVVRSQVDLPEVIREEIGALFSRSREDNGFAGEIHFQTVPAFAVAPLGEVSPNTGDLVV